MAAILTCSWDYSIVLSLDSFLQTHSAIVVTKITSGGFLHYMLLSVRLSLSGVFQVIANTAAKSVPSHFSIFNVHEVPVENEF